MSIWDLVFQISPSPTFFSSAPGSTGSSTPPPPSVAGFSSGGGDLFGLLTHLTDPFQGALGVRPTGSRVAVDPGASVRRTNVDVEELEAQYGENLNAYFGENVPHYMETSGHELAIARAGGSKPVMTRIRWSWDRRTGNWAPDGIDTVDGSTSRSAAHPTRTALPSGIAARGMPRIYGATPEEAAKIMQVLSRIPEKDRRAIRSIIVHEVPGVNFSRDVHAHESGNNDDRRGIIEISRQDLNDPVVGTHVLLHEVGHVVTHAYGVTDGPNSPWGRPPFATPYAASSKEHDFAETYAAFYGDNPKLKARIDQAKANLLATGNLGSLYRSGRMKENDSTHESAPFNDADFLNIELQKAMARQRAGWSLDQIRAASYQDFARWAQSHDGRGPWVSMRGGEEEITQLRKFLSSLA